ncbi:MAG: acylphosphatase [Rhodanobacter sp.]
MLTAHFVIRGHVQGVFFRASAREQAVRNSVTGYAQNQADGSVEVLASGLAEALDQLECWLRQGPPAARVDTVVRQSVPTQNLHGFDIR